MLMQPMPSSTSIDDLGHELTHHGMQTDNCNHFLTALRTAAPSGVIAQLLEMKEDKVKNLEEVWVVGNRRLKFHAMKFHEIS